MPMQIALVADLHGNMPAVEALDADIKRRGIDTIWCLGDVVGKGPRSAETFDWAMANCPLILQGNWDEGVGKRQFPSDQFYYNQLGEHRMKKLLEFPLEHSLTLSGRKIRLFHGRPIMRQLRVIQDDSALLEEYFLPDYNIVGYGDAHRQGLRIVTNKGQMFNTGSVGNGLGMPVVQYAILQGEPGPRPAPLDILFAAVPYDNEAAARDARAASALPHADAFEREVLTGIYSR